MSFRISAAPIALDVDAAADVLPRSCASSSARCRRHNWRGGFGRQAQENGEAETHGFFVRLGRGEKPFPEKMLCPSPTVRQILKVKPVLTRELDTLAVNLKISAEKRYCVIVFLVAIRALRNKKVLQQLLPRL